MKKTFSLLLTVATLFFFSCTNGQKSTGNILAPQEFQKKITEMSQAPIVDVRTPEEFQKGHIKNAVNINWNGDDFEKQISKLDKSKPVFVYCLSGGRSGAAAKQMRSDGFEEVYELSGGMLNWRSANMPETTDSKPASNGMTKEQFDALLNSDKMVLVDFYADWCEPCKKMKPYLEELSKDMADKLVLVRINADENPALCKEMKVEGLPALQVYKNKNLTWSHMGYISKEDVVKNLQ